LLGAPSRRLPFSDMRRTQFSACSPSKNVVPSNWKNLRDAAPAVARGLAAPALAGRPSPSCDVDGVGGVLVAIEIAPAPTASAPNPAAAANDSAACAYWYVASWKCR
jgi:hypothetical protein